MPDAHLLTLGGWLIAVAAFALGFAASALIARDRDRLDALELAERADANSRRLLVIARCMRDTPADEFARQDLDNWARELEDAAMAHLQCINAIGLSQLHAVGYDGTYLGEFGEAAEPPPARDARGRRRG